MNPLLRTFAGLARIVGSMTGLVSQCRRYRSAQNVGLIILFFVLSASASAVPTAPSGLGATNLKATSFVLHWSAAVGGAGGIAGYNIYRDGALVGSATARAFAISGLAPLTAYRMAVVAQDGAGNLSAPSAEFTITTIADTVNPSRPTGLAAASVTTNSFTLTWTPSADNVGVVGYNIYRTNALVGSAAGTFLDLSGLAPDTNHRMSVRATDAAGNLSAASANLTVRTRALPPTTPTGLAVTNLKAASFTLKWTASAGGTGGIAGYDIYRDGVLAVSTTRPSFAFIGQIPLTTTNFTVAARDHEGRVSAQSVALSVTTPADTTKPTVPTDVSASVVTHNSFTLVWTPSTDNVGVTGYDVLKNGAVIGSTTGISYGVTGLTPLTAYSMRLRAKDAAGNISGLSAILSVTTGAVPNIPPLVTLTSPALGTTFTLPVTLTLAATATDIDGSIAKVEFFDGPVKLGEALTPAIPPSTFMLPFNFTVVGSHTLLARATDNRNATTDSSAAAIHLLAGLPYVTDFEATEGYAVGSLDRQQGWTVASGSAQITTSDSAHGEQSVVLGAGSTAALVDQEIGPAETNPSPVFADLLVRPVAGADPATGTVLDLDNARVAFVFDSTSGIHGAPPMGQFALLDGDGSGAGAWKTILLPVPLDPNHAAVAWHRVTARIDYAAKTWDFYIDGQLVAYELRFRSGTATYFSGLSFQGHPTVASGIDDFYAGPTNPLFSDVNSNGIDDAWETAHSLSLSANNRNLSPAGNGVTVLQAYLAGTDPNDFYNGAPPKLTVVSGDNQIGMTGQFNAQPMVIAVQNAAGTAPLANAPVTFTVQSGGGQLALIGDGASPLVGSLSLITDVNGNAQVYYQQPGTPDIVSTISASAGASLITFTTTSAPAVPADSDLNGLPDAWEMQHFGYVGVDPNGDPDGDGSTNLQEYLRGSDPTDRLDGELPYLTSLVANDGTLGPGDALSVLVTDNAGRPIANAPVSVRSEAGGHEFTQAVGGQSSDHLTIQTGPDGIARVFLVPGGGNNGGGELPGA